jgi:hypothetical protein
MNDNFNLEEIIEGINKDISQSEKNEVIKGFIISRISHLTAYLNQSDYKIIKCYESQLSNEEMPYNIEELLTERKAWREEINALEFELSMVGN